MNKKIIFFDADGTIARHGEISPVTIEAFKKLKDNGHILVLSTGRAIPAINGDLKEMNFDNIICSAGGAVVVNNELVYSNPMKKESQKEILEYFDEHNLIYNLESNDYIWIRKDDKEKYLRLFTLPEKSEVSDEEYDLLSKRLECISAITKETDNLMEIETNKLHYYAADILYDDGKCPISYEELEAKFGNEYRCVSLSLSKFFSGGEICEMEISKKTGMDVVLSYFNVAKEDIYAIGDDYNDIEMLEYATHSIAMGQAPEAVKKVSNYITKSIDEEGFYYAMEHFGLI